MQLMLTSPLTVVGQVTPDMLQGKDLLLTLV